MRDVFEIRGEKYVDLNDELFRLACQFRGVAHDANCDELRKKIAADYEKEVKRLIATKQWNYAPNFDEMLTDEYMPKCFNEYWNSDAPHNVKIRVGMTKHDDLWGEINNLLRVMEDLEVVKLVKEHYAKYSNDAPPLVLQRRMDTLQKALDEAEAIE